MWLARVGRWLAAEQWFSKLAEVAADVPPVWFNLGIIRGWLAQNTAAAEALRQYSVLDGVPLEEAVEAEALAQVLEPVAEEDQVPAVRVTYTTDDLQKVLELLLSHQRASKLPIDVSQESPEGDPPPTAAFRLLDRPLLTDAESLSLETVPSILGQVTLYGKQTDRDARVALAGIDEEPFQLAGALLEEIAGSALGKPSEKEVLHSFAAMRGNLDPRWQLPEGLTRERIHALFIEHGANAYLNRWPQQTVHMLENKTPLEAAGDARLRIRVLAQIMVSEMTLVEQRDAFDFNLLRAKLGLPTLDTIDPTTVDLLALPMNRWHRLEVDKLDDDALVRLLGVAIRVRAGRNSRLLALEAIDRPSLEGKISKAFIYNELCQLESDPIKALEYLNLGRDLAEADGHSSAIWDLQELSIRNEMGEPYEVKRLLDHLSTEHISEPGVRQAVVQFLTSIGVLDSDGQMRQPAAEAEPAETVAAGEPSGESSKIWTPDSEQGSKEKPALWTPGMD